MLQPHEDDSSQDGAPVVLTEAIARHHLQLRQVMIHVRRGRSGYVYTGKYLNIVTPSELEAIDQELAEEGDDPLVELSRGASRHEDTPDEIAAMVWVLARRHCAEHGSAYYKFLLRDCDGKELTSQPVILPVSDSSDDTASVPQRESEVVDVLSLARQIAADSHRNYMDVVKAQVGLLREQKENASVAANERVEIAKLQFAMDEKKVDGEVAVHEARASAAKWASAMSPLSNITDHIGQALAERLKFWLAWLEQQAGVGGAEGPVSSFGVALDEVLAGVDLSAVQAACVAVDVELWVLLGELRGTGTDDARFQNLAVEFKKRAMAAFVRKKNPNQIMEALEATLSVASFQRLTMILRAAGAL